MALQPDFKCGKGCVFSSNLVRNCEQKAEDIANQNAAPDLWLKGVVLQYFALSE